MFSAGLGSLCIGWERERERVRVREWEKGLKNGQVHQILDKKEKLIREKLKTIYKNKIWLTC